WAGKVKQPALFEEDEWVPFAVLTFLRIEHTLRHKEIISKRQAGELALQSVDDKWHRLIRESLRIQYEQDEQSLYASKAERVAEVLVFAEEYTWVCNQLFA
ncbi:MAG: aminoglycoside adenylyltransferase domain-containing protein, partial [Tumebacillaceae bacterium]